MRSMLMYYTIILRLMFGFTYFTTPVCGGTLPVQVGSMLRLRPVSVVPPVVLGDPANFTQGLLHNNTILTGECIIGNTKKIPHQMKMYPVWFNWYFPAARHVTFREVMYSPQEISMLRAEIQAVPGFWHCVGPPIALSCTRDHSTAKCTVVR